MSYILDTAASCYFNSHLLHKILPPLKGSLLVLNTMPVVLRFVQFFTGRILHLTSCCITLSSIIAIITPGKTFRKKIPISTIQTWANRMPMECNTVVYCWILQAVRLCTGPEIRLRRETFHFSHNLSLSGSKIYWMSNVKNTDAVFQQLYQFLEVHAVAANISCSIRLFVFPDLHILLH